MQRDIRRYLRLRCLIRAGTQELVGYSTNLSVSGMYLRVPRKTLKDVAVDVGSLLEVRFLPSDQDDPIQVSCEVKWVSPEDRDASGRPAIGLGLQILQPNTTTFKRLKAFVNDFRYAVMVVDDDPKKVALFEDAVAVDYRLLVCLSAEDAMSVLDVNEVAVLIVSQATLGANAPWLLNQLSEAHPRSLFSRIVIVSQPEAETLQAFINVGRVFNCLSEPIAAEGLREIVDRAVQAYALAVENERLNIELERANQRLQRENAYLRQRLTGEDRFDQIIGKSPKLRQSLAELERIRRSDATVHIRGETGTGKELVAHALHDHGPRKSGPFIVQNCAGMNEQLLQSTLFGHQKGAFTGADRIRLGVFQEADGGTLFLDEVAELPMIVQGALLRALQEGEVVPVGAAKPTKVDVRFVSATHKDLREEVKQGRFREDLYFRLVVIAVTLPPLRERVGDVPFLACHFLDRHCERYGKDVKRFTAEVMTAFERYSWPGNIRELNNEVERLVVLAEDEGQIGPDLLSAHIRAQLPGPFAGGLPKLLSTDDIVIPRRLSYDDAVLMLEQALVKGALEDSGGVVKKAADTLGMERTRLLKLSRRLGVTRSS